MTIYTAVSFKGVPLTEIGALANRIVGQGWKWTYNGPDWIAHFEKENGTEAEIQAIMGSYYRGPEKIKADAEEFRSRFAGRDG